MAITAGDYMVLRHIRANNLLPKGCSFLELGEQNWYGDVTGNQLTADIAPYDPDGSAREKLRVVCQIPDPKNLYLFDVADIAYEVFIQHDPAKRMSLDMNGRDRAIKHDLNTWMSPGDHPDCLAEGFDYVNNLGTGEHVFNQDGIFGLVHERCKVSGLMHHALPMWGWLDHGFYNYHPTFIADLVAANGYEVVLWLFSEVSNMRPPNVHKVDHEGTGTLRGVEHIHKLHTQLGPCTSAMSHLLLRKVKSDHFKVPYQGYYKGVLPPEMAKQWSEGR